MLASYLSPERDLGRLRANADVETLASMLMGAGALLFAATGSSSTDAATVEKIVATATSGVRPTRPLR